MSDAYLDIETTGLSRRNAEITVIGIYLVGGRKSRLVQLVGRDVKPRNLLAAIEEVKTIYTYNGRRFDLPFIHYSMGIDLETLAAHHDLMYDCWQCNLRGGFKAVEAQLGIARKLQGLNGWDAVRLWYRYLDYGDLNALATLLQYNREDVINLKELKEKLVRFAGLDL